MATNTTNECISVDGTFGPYAGHCRGGFDFTLQFEEIVLSIVPSAIFLVVGGIRLLYLRRQTKKVNRSPMLYCKMLSYLIFGCLQLAFIVLWENPKSDQTQLTNQSNSLSLLGAILLLALSFFEQLRSIKPSFTIIAYLFLSLLFDIARTRTLWLRNNDVVLQTVFSVITGVKLVILCLEAVGKRGNLKYEYMRCSPEATSGPFSRVFFWWLNPLFKVGYSKTLEVDDLFTLDQRLQSENLHNSLAASWLRADKSPNALFYTTFGTVKWSLLAAVLPRLCLTGFSYCQPFLINTAISISQRPIDSLSTSQGIGMIGAYFIVYVGIAISTGQVQHMTYRTITMVRGSLVSMLYRKTTELDMSAVDPSAAVILMSADIERITTGWEKIHELWANVLEIGLAIYLLQRQLGIACTIPVGVALFSMMGAIVASGLIMARQARWLEAIERRVTATSSMLGAMKGIKMCGLTDILATTLQALRVEELQISKKFRHVIVWNMIFSFSTPVIAPILTFATYILLAKRMNNGTTLDTARVFTSLSLFQLLSEPLGSFIMSLANFLGSVGSFQRIQDFLQAEDRIDDRTISQPFNQLEKELAMFSRRQPSSKHTVQPGTPPPQYPIEASSAIVVYDGSFGWNKEKQPVLSSINITVPREKLTMLIGPVGCGKSTLIKAILGETFKFAGRIHIASSEIAFCDQTSWHMNGTIQESILGMSPVDEVWYKTVIEACALNTDLSHLPRGDQTRIGSAGVALSGGQSQRIALARAIYARQEIALLDDAFRGLDADTENTIFNNLLGQHGLLRKHRITVVIASSSPARLPYADHIIVLNKAGNIEEQGVFAELNIVGGYVSTFNLPAPLWDTNSDEIHAMDGDTPRTSSEPDMRKETSKDIVDYHPKSSASSETAVDDDSRRMGDTSVYMYYVSAVGWLPTAIFVIFMCAFVVTYSYPTVWAKQWASANAVAPNQRIGYYLGIYTLIGVVALTSLIVSSWQMIITMVPRSGERFHWLLLKAVLSSPISFFSTTDTGVTLNRFSQDLQLIDMDLPLAALNTFAILVLCVAQIIIIGVASMYAPITFPFILVLLYFIQRYYLRTSRQLRFLDIEAKSPVYSSFLECLSGLVTIRAFGWSEALEKKNLEMLDQSQRPFYQLFMVQRWLILVLDLVVAGIAVLLMTFVVALRGTISSGFVGVMLLNVIMFSQSIKLLLTYWTEVETHIGSIARIKTFTAHAESEDLPNENQEPPPEWPPRGSVEFSNVSAAYRLGELVLRGINLAIPAGQKVAIVGRTGSGKSSLLLSLFRMVTLTSGTINIDSLDISLIPRQSLRSRLNGVPQDAYFLTGSVRLNASPRSTATDREIVSALKSVELWDIIRCKGGLDASIDSIFLSHGQKQLFCIARAILRKSTILVLDEATSSVDRHTDELIQRLIRKHFSKHTVISVAHKLEGIMDFDCVVVMDQGRVVEKGSPWDLLDVEGGYFAKLYWTGIGREEEGEVGRI